MNEGLFSGCAPPLSLAFSSNLFFCTALLWFDHFELSPLSGICMYTYMCVCE